MRRNFLLGLDRVLAGKPRQQIVFFAMIFTFFLVVFGAVYYWKFNEGNVLKSIAQAFVDMISPVTARNIVYDDSQPISPDMSKRQYVTWLSIVYLVGLIVFTGLLIATITNIIRTRADKFKQGTVKYHFRNHIVFLGYDDMIVGMINRLCEKNDARIVVGVEENASKVSDAIHNRIYEKYRNNVVVLKADCCNLKDLKRLRILNARQVYIIGEHGDAYNLQGYKSIYELSISERSFEEKMPQCFVNFRSQSTFVLFQTYASLGEIGIDYSHFHTFNFEDEWARMMLKGFLFDDETGKKNNHNLETKRIHLVIVGMTEMGKALIREALLMCHFIDFVKSGVTTLISIIDSGLGKEMSRGQYRNIFETYGYSFFNYNDGKDVHYSAKMEYCKPDIEFEFIEASLDNNRVRSQLSEWSVNKNESVAIAICLESPESSITEGLCLPDECLSENVDVWVFQPTKGDYGTYMQHSKFKNVKAFGMSGGLLDIADTTSLRTAQIINHHKYQKGIIDSSYTNDNLIDAEWSELTVAEKWDLVRQASFLPYLMTLTDSDRSELVAIEHNRWVADRIISGHVISKEEIDMRKEYEESYINSLTNILYYSINTNKANNHENY